MHGIGYIFDGHLGLVDRGLWLVIAISSMSLAMWMITSLYTDWQGSQVITTLKTTTKSVSELDFPTVTICADGQHMSLVEKVIYNNFIDWKKDNDKNGFLKADFKEFMQEIFQIPDKGTTIMDILNMMITPESAGVNEVRRNALACEKKKRRRKRSTIDATVENTKSG